MNDHLKVLGFRHVLELIDPKTGEVLDREEVVNRIPQAGIDFLMQAPFGDVAAVPNFYCGLFRNNFIPVAGTTAADIPTAMGEWVDYSEGTRPLWDRAYNGAGTYDNTLSKAVFTPTADANLYGSFICSSAEKGGNTGLLISVARFSTVKPVSTGVEARLSCGLTYLPSTSI